MTNSSQARAVAIILLLLFLFGAISIAAWGMSSPNSTTWPVVVQTGAGKPNYYCQKIDSATRVAYECFTRSWGGGYISEYHLSAFDSFEIRNIEK